MKVREIEDGYREPIYGSMNVSNNYVKVYDDATYVLATVHGCPRLLLEYFCRIMDSDNIVHISSVTKENFLRDILDNAGITYSMISVDKAIAKMKEHNLILHVQRGIVQINPKYFFKGDSEKRRMQLIIERVEKEMKKI